MKLWHALCLLLIVLVGTESLVDRKGETSAIESAETRLAQRAAAGKQAGPATKAEAPQVKTANLKSWFSPDEDGTVDLSEHPTESVAQAAERDGSLRPIGAPAAMPALAPSAVPLSHAGSAIRLPKTELIEGAI